MSEQEDAWLREEVARAVTTWTALHPTPDTCGVNMFIRSFEEPKFCGRSLYSGTERCYWHSPEERKYDAACVAAYFGPGISLREALTTEVRAGRPLDFACLRNASIGGDFLRRGPDLSGIRLVGADLSGSVLSYCNLSGAQLQGADLRRARLSECILSKTNFYHALLHGTKFRKSDLSEVLELRKSNFRGVKKRFLLIHNMNEQYPNQAGPMYLELGKYFAAQGLLDDASWAAYRASLMRHQILTERVNIKATRARILFQPLFNNSLIFDPEASNSYIEWLYNLVAWMRSFLILQVTGYGEKPWRVIWAAALVMFVYGLFYTLPTSPTARDLYSSLYFSIITFTTLGYGDIVPRGAFRFIAGSEALVGIMLTGLFLFCFGRRSTSRL